ncbi:anti-sigma factor domain-containing protein [Schlesneria sp. T3-172]|uniref:anti-sigma factor domain-containing protein n=1 Tax=Schlesneria sphaerica TaxID=3373610 RepID=UPI0037C5E0D2
MNNPANGDNDRWEELQITRLLFGLSPDEQTEFDRLAEQSPVEQLHHFEQVVASLDLAWSDSTSMPLPDHLRKAIRSRAIEELGGPVTVPTRPLEPTKTSSPRSSKFPWLVAAACMVITMLTLFNSKLDPLDPSTALDLSQQRLKLISTIDDVVQVDWAPGPTEIANAAGDVVWSPSEQSGFMRFRGLPVNDPTREQYQLWIFDKNQDDKTPIDGGVFDISSEQEAIVSIHAKLRVQEAYLFAVTIEKPGGVVVSSRERLPLLAEVK